MMERPVPWWRRALTIALDGIRSGFGLFRRSGKAAASAEVARQAEVADERREAERDETEVQKEESRVKPSSPQFEATAAEEPTAAEDFVAGDNAPPDQGIARAAEMPAPEPTAPAPEPPAPEPASPIEDAPAAGPALPIEEPPAATESEPATAPVVQAAEELSGEPQDMPGDDFNRAESVLQSVGALAPVASFPSTEPEVLSASESPGEPAEPTAAAGETTQPVETASAEEMTELLEIAAPSAPEEAAAPEVQSSPEEATTHVALPGAPATPPVEELAEPPERDPELPPVTDPVPVPKPPVTEPPIVPEPPQPEPPEPPEPPAPPPLPVPEPPPAPPVTEPTGLDPLPAPVPIDAAPTLPFPEKPQRTTAEKVAAALKARGEDADQSPFSVLVNQVYDGPLDLLLDLIRKQDIDIYDIPIAKITAQFLAYVDQLRAGDMDVAGDFIYTAALLIHIKSRMLLPRTPSGPDDTAEDPRRELVDRLLEHERFKNAAQMLREKQMLEASTWTNPGIREFQEDAAAEPEIAADTTDLVRIFSDILERARNRPILNLQEDSVTVGQMIQFLARRLTMEDKPVALRRMLSHTKSERALIAMFLALLELVRLQAILLRQDRHFSEIFIKKHTGFDALMNQGLSNARDDWR